ncbi:MAG: LPXTG cell wall anchor domain-containing protein [Corynebacterium sp.]|nr:LPXTG cell wall anchor domain-containing protein [Corynebacterium sp.]
MTVEQDANREVFADCVIPAAELAGATNPDELKTSLQGREVTIAVEQADVRRQPDAQTAMDSEPELVYAEGSDEHAIVKVEDTLTLPDGRETTQVLAEQLHGKDALEGKTFTYAYDLQKATREDEQFVNKAALSGGSDKSATATVTLTPKPDPRGPGFGLIPIPVPVPTPVPGMTAYTGELEPGREQPDQKAGPRGLANTGASVLGIAGAAAALIGLGVLLVRRRKSEE